VEFVRFIANNQLQPVLDAEISKDNCFGVHVSSMPVLETIKLNIVESVRTFPVTYLSINMIQSMDQKVLFSEQDS
jgi:hypothetical protein